MLNQKIVDLMSQQGDKELVLKNVRPEVLEILGDVKKEWEKSEMTEVKVIVLLMSR